MSVVSRDGTDAASIDFHTTLTKIKGKHPDAITYGGMDATGSPPRRARELDVEIHGTLVNRAIGAWFSSIGALQQLLKGICIEEKESEWQRMMRKINNVDFLAWVIEVKTRDYATRHQRVLEAISAGHTAPQGRTGAWHPLNAGPSVRRAYADRSAGADGDSGWHAARGGNRGGYKGVAIDGVKIYHPGLRRGTTRRLRAMIRRRSAIEPAIFIGPMKADGKLDRNWFKRVLGDAIRAVMCGVGHSMRMILRKPRLLCAFALAALLNQSIAADLIA